MHSLEPPQLRWIGTIVRPHGLDGSLHVELAQSVFLAEGTPVWIGFSARFCNRSQIESFTLSGSRAILRLAGITTRQQAETLREHGVFIADSSVQIPRRSSELVGWTAVLSDGTAVGTVVGIEENPAHPLLCIARPQSGEFRVPFVDVFVQHVESSTRTIVLSLPEGFLEAQLPTTTLPRKRKR
ncbi:MAG: hypothetical protein AA908_03305 [Chlorobi bacterium NICIL-2]|jgi:16S rRNA processing protein RimM|nr:MAG: hypothetical protein AA908_03305 [Chlorobi bacterium NICIL-2]